MSIDTSKYISDQDRDDFRSGYVSAMLWANTIVEDENGCGESEDVSYMYVSPGRWWEDTPADLSDANSFLEENIELMRATGNDDMSQHGHDFALTRNGHGAGFWDRGYGTTGDELTAAAHAYGEETIFLPWESDEDEDNDRFPDEYAFLDDFPDFG